MVHTDAGIVMGTVAYMSPEQVRGREVDQRTDIWSLGVMLYEMVAGRCPFTGQSRSEVLAAILDREPAPLARFEPNVPSELQRLVGKALRKDRDERYQGMKDLQLDLQALRDELAGEARKNHQDALLPEPVAASVATPVPGSTSVTVKSQSSAEYVITQAGRRKVTVVLATCALALITVGAWWVLRNRAAAPGPQPPSAPVQRPLTRLTFGSGLQTDVTWSPDGRFIAYASDRAGNFDIWVQPVSGGNPVQVTRSAAQDTQPGWSADGSTLVFRSERDGGGLFLVPALGGLERQLTSFGSYPSWSPNGKAILFVRAGLFLDSSMSGIQLYAVSPEEGVPREILADFFTGGWWSWMAPHPDGRISVLGRHRQLGLGFFTVARDGTRLVQSKASPDFPLHVHGGDEFVRRRFQWHPSGSALYVQTETNGVYNLWKVNVDPSTLAWMSAERLTTGAGPDVGAALSRDGTRLAFTTEHGATRLWVFPLDPAAHRVGPGKPLTEDDAVVKNSTLSPDGQYVAYNLRRPGIDHDELWITNVVHGTSELVSTTANCLCAWSPDGTAIAYTYWKREKEPQEWALAIRQLGGKERFISRWSTTSFHPSSWSAERGLLGTYSTSFPVGDDALALWPTTNPDADKPDRVLMSKLNASFWQGMFSPNGRWVSFVAINNDHPAPVEIGVASADASRSQQWTRIAADHTAPDKPRWAPDGLTLYFISRRPASYLNLWAVRFDPERGTPVGEPYVLTQFDSPSMVISPDLSRSEMDVSARHAVLTMKTVSGSIWMLDHVDR
jgi:Tol biopolymer transport system component